LLTGCLCHLKFLRFETSDGFTTTLFHVKGCGTIEKLTRARRGVCLLSGSVRVGLASWSRRVLLVPLHHHHSIFCAVHRTSSAALCVKA
jgi:hypothetical protein